MGLRYLIAVPRDGQTYPVDLDAKMVNAGFQRVEGGCRCWVYLNHPDRWAKFADEGGIIVGDLFEKHTRSKPIFAGRVAPHAEDLDTLVRAYWGGYVALRSSVFGLEFFRDPSGVLPAYRIDCPEGYYLTSDLPLLVEVGLYAPRISWPEVAWFYYTNGFPTPNTALVGVEQILPATAVPLKDSMGPPRLLWSPWDFADARDQGSDALRAITIDCVRAWQARYGSVMAGVSGGLDSSILACSLDNGASVTGLTISTADLRGDELRYAAALCEALGIQLIAGQYAFDAVNIDRPSLSHLPRPGGMAQLQAYDAVVTDTIRVTGANAFMSGVGGDNVFNLTRSARPFVDHLLATGPFNGSLRTLGDISRLTGAGRWAVLRAAMRVPKRAGPKYDWPVDLRFLDTALAVELAGRSFEHPWLRAPSGCLPGKHAHVATIVRAHAYVECHDRRWKFASLHPLMSQPIIEMTLATPTWVACEGGVDRARARKAFARDLPATILDRRLKGGPDGFALKLLRAQLPAIRERLLDGHLAREGIICRTTLEPALTEAQLMRGRDYTRILQFLDTEAWANHWLSIVPAHMGFRHH